MKDNVKELKQKIFDLEDEIEERDSDAALSYIDLHKKNKKIESEKGQIVSEKMELEKQNAEMAKQYEELFSQNKRLQEMLQQSLSLVEKVKKSKICKLLLSKDLKTFNQALPAPQQK